MTNKMTKLMIVLGAMTVAGSAMAQSATMGSAAVVAPECSVGNMVALGFGDIQMLSEGAPSTTASESTGGGTFNAICTNGTPGPKFKFTSANTWFNDYRLIGADGTTFLNYTLTTSGNTAISYGTPTTFPGFAADGTTQSLRIKGSIAAADKQGKLVQQYSDTITVTASFGL